jgi:type IV pilus assembly protein PilX
MVNRVNQIITIPLVKKQQGVVLIVALVFLIALTSVAAAIMQNTTTDMKMSGASEDKVIATQEAISSIDEVIYRQVNGGSGNNGFSSAIVKFPLTLTDTLTETNSGNTTTASVDITNNEFELEADCPHSTSASSTQIFTCNVLRVQVSRHYGRTKTNEIVVNSGVAQQLLR